MKTVKTLKWLTMTATNNTSELDSLNCFKLLVKSIQILKLNRQRDSTGIEIISLRVILEEEIEEVMSLVVLLNTAAEEAVEDVTMEVAAEVATLTIMKMSTLENKTTVNLKSIQTEEAQLEMVTKNVVDMKIVVDMNNEVGINNVVNMYNAMNNVVGMNKEVDMNNVVDTNNEVDKNSEVDTREEGAIKISQCSIKKKLNKNS